MRVRDNKGVDLKELFSIRVPGLPGAAHYLAAALG